MKGFRLQPALDDADLLLSHNIKWDPISSDILVADLQMEQGLVHHDRFLDLYKEGGAKLTKRRRMEIHYMKALVFNGETID